MDRINCNNTLSCPKGSENSGISTLNFIFFGCWGVYCKDGPNVIYVPSLGSEEDIKERKKEKKNFKTKIDPFNIQYESFWGEDTPEQYDNLTSSNVLYGEKTVARLMETYSRSKKITAMLISGDNVYQDSLDPNTSEILYNQFVDEYNIIKNMTDSDKKQKKLKNIRKKYAILSHDIKKQYEIGFIECFKNIRVNEYLIGIGNHDIKSCQLFNDEMELFKKNIPGMYFNYTYTLQSGKIVNFIFMDTNMYDYDDDEQGNPKPAVYCKTGYVQEDGQETYTEEDRTRQKSWLDRLLSQHINSWNILIGHIPFKYVNNKLNNQVTTAKYFDIFMSEYNSKIDLYLCADRHNQQYITHQNRPPEVICGSGGTEPDIFTNLILNTDRSLSEYTQRQDYNSVKYFDSVFGFAGLNISDTDITIEFIGVNVLETRHRRMEERIINQPHIFTININDKIDRIIE